MSVASATLVVKIVFISEAGRREGPGIGGGTRLPRGLSFLLGGGGVTGSGLRDVMLMRRVSAGFGGGRVGGGIDISEVNFLGVDLGFAGFGKGSGGGFRTRNTGGLAGVLPLSVSLLGPSGRGGGTFA